MWSITYWKLPRNHSWIRHCQEENHVIKSSCTYIRTLWKSCCVISSFHAICPIKSLRVVTMDDLWSHWCARCYGMPGSSVLLSVRLWGTLVCWEQAHMYDQYSTTVVIPHTVINAQSHAHKHNMLHNNTQTMSTWLRSYCRQRTHSAPVNLELCHSGICSKYVSD